MVHHKVKFPSVMDMIVDGGVRLKTAGDHRRPYRDVTAGRVLSRRHRQKARRLAAAAAGKKRILPLSANSTDSDILQFNITLLRFCIISRYKPVRNTPNTNFSVPQSALDFFAPNFQ